MMPHTIPPHIEIALIQAASAFTVEFMRAFQKASDASNSLHQKGTKTPQHFDEHFIALYFCNTLSSIKTIYTSERSSP